MMLLATAESSSKHREDFDLSLGAGELGNCGGVEIVIFS